MNKYNLDDLKVEEMAKLEEQFEADASKMAIYD